jgi:Spy/CpxP family protein refolding chaperone
MWFRSALVLAASLLAGTTVRAQAPGGYQPPGGSMSGGGAWDGGGGRRMGPPQFDPSELPSPEDIDGPPNPATLRQLLSLTDQQTQQYTHAWDSLMAGTRVQRDSARAAREAMQSAFQARNRDAVQEQAKLLTELGRGLRKQDEAFVKSLGFLTGEQRKQYQEYQKEQRKARDEERRQRFRERLGDEPPGSP